MSKARELIAPLGAGLDHYKRKKDQKESLKYLIMFDRLSQHTLKSHRKYLETYSEEDRKLSDLLITIKRRMELLYYGL